MSLPSSVTPSAGPCPDMPQKVGSRSMPIAMLETRLPAGTVPGCRARNGTR